MQRHPMKSPPLSLMLAGAVLAAFPAGASAYCRLPDGVTASPRAAANWVLDSSDVVGFAVVRTRENAAAGQAEALDLLFPMKGSPGPVTMRLDRRGGAVLVTNGATTFDVASGTVVFAALNLTPGGAVISECKALLFARVPREQVIGALWEMWRAGEIAGTVRR
jgi:hypothetical protein